MSADAQILDRIDVRWSVRTRSIVDTAFGKAVVNCSFSIVLGTYDGPTTQKTLADNINGRGVYEDDIDSVSCIDGDPSVTEIVQILAACSVRPEDVVEMIIQDVIVDDGHEIASSIMEPRR